MRIARNLRIAGILKRIGSRPIKKWIWDREFAAGCWDFMDRTSDDPLYPVLARYARRGNILDLGCGAGNTGCELDPGLYGGYTGVDISAEAVERACRRSAGCGREGKNTFLVSDVADFRPSRTYEVILFRESLYYLGNQALAVLQRYQDFLSPDGVFVVRIDDGRKFAWLIRAIERKWRVLEKSRVKGSDAAILVFRGKR